MKNKKRSKKNYVILGVIYIVVILVVLYLASWYNTYSEYKREIPVLKDVVSFISPEEVDHYLTENPSPILYLCTASDSDCREFEENIKQDLEEKNYQELTYVNLESLSDKSGFLQELLDKYGQDFSIERRVPCLIKFVDGRIVSIEDGLNGAVLTRDEALEFLDTNDSDLEN